MDTPGRIRVEAFDAEITSTAVFRTGAGSAEWFAPFGLYVRGELAELDCACRWPRCLSDRSVQRA
jgi:hypothetical protein